ncbi:MAG: Uma2 family endonuclease [Chloroflexota bacterium]
MAVEILKHGLWRVATYVPNERETQILGGTQTHASVGINLYQTLRTYAARQGLSWLVRFEGELRYPRVDGTTGVFYPDLFMAPGVVVDNEEPYEVSTVGHPPALVVEIASKKTVRRDVGPKRQAYAELGVAEYLTFDPRHGKGLALQGYRLAGQGRYREIAPAPDRELWLETIGLWVRAEAPLTALDGPLLRLTTREGERLLHSEEEAEAREVERQWREAADRARAVAVEGWDAERQAREAAQAEIARLRALLGDLAP